MIPVNPFDSTGAGQSLTSTPISLSPLNMGCLSADPDVAFSNIGDFYLNTTNNILRIFDGTLWNDWGVYGGSAQLTASNTFTRGPQAIQTGSDGNPGFNIFRNSASQSGALLTLFHSNFISVLARFDANGNLTLRNDNGVAAGIPLSITANATQSSNLFQILASDNSTVRAAIGSAGALTLTPSSGTAATINAAASAIGLAVKANATTPGNLQEWQDNAGTGLTVIDYQGSLLVNTNNIAPTNQGYSLRVKRNAIFDAGQTTIVPLNVWGRSGQTANLTNWYSDQGTTTVASIAASGALTLSPSSGTAAIVNIPLNSVGLQLSPNASSTSGDSARFWHTNASVLSSFNQASQLLVRGDLSTKGYLNSAITAYTGNDGYSGLIIRANSATQSADLQQWQTSAANTITRIVAGGGIIAVEPIVTSTAGAGTTTTLDCSTGTTFTVTFGAGNITGLLFTNLPNAGSVTITLILKQDSVGSRTITWSGTQVNGSSTNATPKWAGGTAPTLTTTANAVDMVTLVINRTSGATDNVYGFLAGKAFA